MRELGIAICYLVWSCLLRMSAMITTPNMSPINIPILTFLINIPTIKPTIIATINAVSLLPGDDPLIKMLFYNSRQ